MFELCCKKTFYVIIRDKLFSMVVNLYKLELDFEQF